MRTRLAVCCGIALAALAACSRDSTGASPENAALVGGSAAPPMLSFVDVTNASGVDFVHENGSFGKKWLPETMGSGVASFDFDRDGRLDLFFVNQRRWPGREREYATPASRPATPKLYRNEGGWRFADVTAAAGLDVPSFGMGVAAGDLDGDGDDDLVVTALGDTQLFRKDDARFVECARESGVVTPRWRDKGGAEHPMWGTAAALLDFDRDGALDLFVAAYAKWSESTDIFATLDGSTKAFTTPDLYPGDSSRLYRGLGAGRFEDATELTGVANPNGKSLGVAVCDVNEDGWSDLAVANDTHPNFLYLNEQGRFRDVAKTAGVAYDANGRARAGMGIDAARLTPGAATSIAIGNFSLQPVSLFVDAGRLAFTDRADAAALAAATTRPLTFGVAFADVDLDGRLDLLLGNGHIEPTVALVQREIAFAQAPQLFWNRGDGRFLELSKSVGTAFTRGLVGRGLCASDLDGDGDPDLVITQNGGRAVVLRCDREGAAREHRYLRVRLIGRDGNRAALGAVVRATFGGRTEERTVRTGSSYLSQSDTAVTFGLGALPLVDRLEVRWPWGDVTTRERIPASNETLVVTP